MKNNKVNRAARIIFVAITLMIANSQGSAQQNDGAISLSLKTEKYHYVLGEIVDAKFQLSNDSDKSVVIDRPSVERGNVRFFVAYKDEKFKQYSGPGWALRGSGFTPEVTLETGSATEISATMLYHNRKDTSHLSPAYAQRINDREVNGEFVFDLTGVYFLKAIYFDSKTKRELESEPVEINVTEPVGFDAVVWEQIKTDGAFAYFLHTGGVKYQEDSAEAQKFVEKLKSITSDYPNTNFSERLNEGLAKYQRNLENVQVLVVERQATN